MDVFSLRDKVIGDYSKYVESFQVIGDETIEKHVREQLGKGLLWPDPLIQMNPAFQVGESIEQLVRAETLHEGCRDIFRDTREGSAGKPISLYRHQVEGIRAAREGDSYVLTTGTGSGKSLAYIVPIIDHILRHGTGRGIQAIIVYPMNALANSQVGELEKFLGNADDPRRRRVSFARYTGQEPDERRDEIFADPPDILLTNYVMLEFVLTRPRDRALVRAAQGLRFLVLDELHTYRGRQGADVAMLVRRVRESCKAQALQHIGTSATLASKGSWAEQREQIASMATTLFGTEIRPDRVIGETLRRVTPPVDVEVPDFKVRLRERIAQEAPAPEPELKALANDPLIAWIEDVLGPRREDGGDRLVRREPRPMLGDGGIAAELAEATQVEEKQCAKKLRETLLVAHNFRDEHNHPLFAFRLHQFVSKGDTVYASPEPESARYVTLRAQRFVPESDRQKVLLPLAFCRVCGQDYYSVRRRKDRDGNHEYVGRPVSDQIEDEDSNAGFLYISEERPWPESEEERHRLIPDSWLERKEDGGMQVRQHQRKNLPKDIRVSTLAVEGDEGTQAWWLKSPFQFCLRCGFAHGARQRTDFPKLATLGSEGRSTATTVMTLSTLRQLRTGGQLDPEARKLLSFTDNRQDASFQAGHFNDFTRAALLRSALYRAVAGAGKEGISHEQLALRVFDALGLPLKDYAVNPDVRYAAREETDRALREVLGYRVYSDLDRGWRITSPNLEQCGLLEFDYPSLKEHCASQDEWKGCHHALAQASPGEREGVCRALLGHMRQGLAIRVSYLDPAGQEGIRELSRQRLSDAWALDDSEKLRRSRTAFPYPRRDKGDHRDDRTHISPKGGFGDFLSRPGTFSGLRQRLTPEDAAKILPQLCEMLVTPGLLHRVESGQGEDGTGYLLNAAALVWKKGTGKLGGYDPVRFRAVPAGGHKPNRFFQGLYRNKDRSLKDAVAREHTAQVPSEVREEREEEFREARLPVLYCSPTMELGVDIAQLNVVNMRNIPPTPANYAQRGGRAGRSGQPAFVFSYCTTGSPHDQYFFQRPKDMVAGAVFTPRIDLENEDLIRAHVHAIWLEESGLTLGSSLRDVLVLEGKLPELPLNDEVLHHLKDQEAMARTRGHALSALGRDIAAMLESSDPGKWLDETLERLPERFNEACVRWRGLYLAAHSQSQRQQQIVLDPSRDQRDKERAKRLRAEAEAQLRILLEESSRKSHSDFYSYRYFACEGFLPGYNFPRLPLSAFIPGRQRRHGVDEFLTRSRFIAVSEFGPGSIVYHEGSRYRINKAIIPVDDAGGTGVRRRANRCNSCAYVHPLRDEPGPDLCENCGEKLSFAYDNLFRMENVSTRRLDRISSDEEERVRQGYDLATGIRFAHREGIRSVQKAQVTAEDGKPLANLSYGHGATLWRMNLGWRRRKRKSEHGFLLDIERGYWEKREQDGDGKEDPMSPRKERVIPFVEDTRNCLLLEPTDDLPQEAMASLEAALKVAIQVHFQIEDRELATDPLPSSKQRKRILFYEAAEGGAGVLRRLVEEPDAIRQIARLALRISHFNPDTGEDLRRPHGKEDLEECVAACYDCLLSYYNQRDHRLLDRQALPALLHPWLTAKVKVAPRQKTAKERLETLQAECATDDQRHWVGMVERLGLNLPSHAQFRVKSCGITADFCYKAEGALVFVDGQGHDTPGQRAKDEELRDTLEDLGLTVIRFGRPGEWGHVFGQFPDLFGESKRLPDAPSATQPAGGFDPEHFATEWREPMSRLASTEGVTVESGADVLADDRVVGNDLATVRRDGRQVRLVDDARGESEAVAVALAEQGHEVLRVTAAEKGLVERVLASLGSGGGGGR